MARVLVLGGLSESLINFRGALLKEMVVRGHEVFACAPNATEDVRVGLSQIGAMYRHVELNRTGINPIRDVQTVKDLMALFRSVRPDVFFGYTIKPVIYGSLVARMTDVSRIYSMVTGLGYAFSRHSLKSKVVGNGAVALYRLALRYNRHVFFQNPDDLRLFLEKRLVHFPGQAVLVNGSGVDVDAFRPASYPKTISFLLIARLIRDKGIYEYVEAARRVRGRFPEIRFRIAGWIDPNPNAIDRDDLERWRKEGVVEYLGRLTDVRPAIANCSVYVLPSYREGTPRTVLEAMAMARPVITTDAPGCRETVQEGRNGFLVPVQDVASLVEAMERFVEQPRLVEKMGRVSREIAVKKYDVRKVNRVLLETMGL